MLAGGDAGDDFVNHGRDAAAYQRGDDDGKARVGGGVAVAAGGAAQYAVRAGEDVDVKAGVDFQRAQDDDVELLDRCAFGAVVGVLVSADFDVVRVTRQRFGGIGVEALYVQQFFDEPFFMQLHHGGGDAAKAEAGGDVVAPHFVFEEAGNGE